MKWYVYIAKCADNSLYTGITTNLKRRIQEHNFNNRLGAKSLRYRRPVTLVYYETFENQTKAAKRERAIKSWTRKFKLKLISGFIFKKTKKGLPLKFCKKSFQGLPLKICLKIFKGL